MNPLTSKREHQVALLWDLLWAIALGLVAGLLFGVWYVRQGFSMYWTLWCDYPDGRIANTCHYLRPGYWLALILCSVLGGLFCGGVVYIRQLLRA